MRSPSLHDLAAPPPGKTGWPWDQETEQLPDHLPDGSAWPLISIVTPSYNRVEYIEEAIRSVLLQGYPALEYIVMDGGSQDGTVEIIQKYSPWLSSWVSEPDNGQVAAINKGFHSSSGQIMAYLNSDDYYLPGAFARAATALAVGNTGLFSGACRYVNGNGQTLNVVSFGGNRLEDYLDLHAYEYSYLTQPEVFWVRQVWQECGEFDSKYEIGFDYDYWLRTVIHGFSHIHSDDQVACFRIHAGQKIEHRSRMYFESVLLAERYLPYLDARQDSALLKRIDSGLRFARRLGWRAKAREALGSGDWKGMFYALLAAGRATPAEVQ